MSANRAHTSTSTAEDMRGVPDASMHLPTVQRLH
jgi:hypothetical protein